MRTGRKQEPCAYYLFGINWNLQSVIEQENKYRRIQGRCGTGLQRGALCQQKIQQKRKKKPELKHPY